MDNKLYVDNEISGFKRGYLIYLGILFVLIMGLLITLWVRMGKYQKNLDEELTKTVIEESQTVSTEDSERAAQKCFTDYADSLTLEGWVNLYYVSHPDGFDSEADVSALITEKIMGASLGKYRAADYTAEEPKYVITADGEGVASFTLSGSENNWTIAATRVFLGGNETAYITAPSDCTVRINGSELTEEFTQIEKAAATVDGYDDALTNPVIMNNYTISGLLNAESDVTAQGAYLSVDGNFYSSVDDSSYIDRARSFIESLLHYYASGKENTDGNASAVMSHVASGSKAASIITSAKSGLEWVPPNHSIHYDIECSEVCKVADNCYFVDVAYTPQGAGADTANDAQAADDGEDSEGDGTDGSDADDMGASSGTQEAVKGAGVYRVYFLDDGSGYRIVLFEGIR